MTKAFNGDETLLQIVKDLVAKHGINLIVETGTYHGETTAALAELPVELFTIELSDTLRSIAKKRCEAFPKITFLNGNSPELIRRISNLPSDRVLYFLDAHWNAYNPLIDELKAIAAAKIQPVILIHDFFIPGKSTTPSAMWGFDTYGGQDYNWEWVKPHVEAIYPDGFVKSYNDHYEATRGCLILEPK